MQIPSNIQPKSAVFDSVAFSQAVDSTLSFTSGGDSPWVIDSSVFKVGISSGKSGIITANQISYLESVVSGKGKISFWWKVSSEYLSDTLDFFISGDSIKTISGVGEDWQYFEFYIGSEANSLLRWVYSKDSVTNIGSDCGWIDNITWIPMEDLFDEVGFASAVDEPTLVFTSGGYVPWKVDQTVFSKYGNSAGRSGAIPKGKSSWVSTTVTGSGTLKFWYKVVGQQYDFLTFYVDDVQYEQFSATSDWSEYVIVLESNDVHILNWTFDRWSIYLGTNYNAWIDYIQWIPDQSTTTTTSASQSTTTSASQSTTTSASQSSSPTSPPFTTISGYPLVIVGMVSMVFIYSLIRKRNTI
jgi:hypothetical protein